MAIVASRESPSVLWLTAVMDTSGDIVPPGAQMSGDLR